MTEQKAMWRINGSIRKVFVLRPCVNMQNNGQWSILTPDRLNIRKNCSVFSFLERWKERRLPLPVETRIVMTIQIVVCDKGNDSFCFSSLAYSRALSLPPSPRFFRLRRYLAIILAFASMEAMAFELLSSPLSLLVIAFASLYYWFLLTRKY